MSTLEVKAIQAPTGYDLQMPAGAYLQVLQNKHIQIQTQLQFLMYTTLLQHYSKFASSKILYSTSAVIWMSMVVNVL